MTRYLTAFTRALDASVASNQIVDRVAALLGEDERLGTGLILATAASGDLGLEVARRLGERWPGVGLVGTSFEGLVADGQIIRDEPALLMLAWTGGPGEPVPFLVPPGGLDTADLAAEILDAAGGSQLASGDLVLLFPDAVASGRLESVLGELGSMLAPAAVAGAAATGIDGHPARVFFDEEAEPGSLLGVFVPAGGAIVGSEIGGDARVRRATGTREASPWLDITQCRERWVDGLDEEPALDWVRRQLGLDPDSPIEPQLGRLLARVRKRSVEGLRNRFADYEERYVVGVDEARGAFALPGTVRRGDQLALALPDSERARETLRSSIAELPDTPLVLQFSCRARDASLHGDPDLEGAWAAHHAPESIVLGTVSPFQIDSGEDGGGRLVVHSTVFVALGDPKE
jgi:small ligand-binding sensory domain FIST